MATITTDTFLDGGVLTIRTDTRVHANATTGLCHGWGFRLRDSLLRRLLFKHDWCHLVCHERTDSGDTPISISLTKTFSYTGSTLTGVSYS